MKALLPILLAPLVTACATAAGGSAAEAEDPPLRVAPEGSCDADGVQGRLGTRATAELGAQLLEDTGADALRWVPPRSAVTLDYRPGRLNVSYDDSFTVTRIHCG